MNIGNMNEDQLSDLVGKALDALPNNLAIDAIIFWLRDQEEWVSREVVDRIRSEVM